MSPRFADPGQERRYRGAFLERDIRHVRGSVLLLVPVVLVFGISDWQLIDDRSLLLGVWGVRLLVGAALAGLAVALGRVRTPETFDRLVFAYLLFGAAALMAVAATRPPDYLAHAIFDVAIVAVFYVLARVPLTLQVVPALLVTGIEVLLFSTVKELDSPLTMNVLLVSLAMANGLGALASRELERTRRAQFALLERETELRRRLEGALAEIDTLRGIVPICSSCKQVRDEDGCWHPIEIYVRARSAADFSHGLCPECAGRWFPGLVVPERSPAGD